MKILVATDGSRGGVAAVNFAAQLAGRTRGSELIVMTIAHPPTDSLSTDTTADARNVLETAARRVRSRGGATRLRLVAARNGTDVPEAISREADRLKADLVVVGSEGRDTLNEWVVGGTALRLIYVARRPVTVVRAPRRRKTA
jgi:nucleotide-binding universal stress UspA family protein